MEFRTKTGLSPREVEILQKDFDLNIMKYEVVGVLTEAEAILIKAMREKIEMPSIKELAGEASREITAAIESFGEAVWAGGYLSGHKNNE